MVPNCLGVYTYNILMTRPRYPHKPCIFATSLTENFVGDILGKEGAFRVDISGRSELMD